MQMISKTAKVLTSLMVTMILASISLKLVQLLANLKTLSNLIPLKAENAPPVEILLSEAASVISIMDRMTIEASNRLNQSLAYFLNPSPISLMTISAMKQ